MNERSPQRTFTEKEVHETFEAFVNDILKPYVPPDIFRFYLSAFEQKLRATARKGVAFIPTPFFGDAPLPPSTFTFSLLPKGTEVATTTYIEAAIPPHCDPDVLHAPGQCQICDEYATAAQAKRLKDGVNFTGERKAGLVLCPADKRRGFGEAENWHGNRRKPSGE